MNSNEMSWVYMERVPTQVEQSLIKLNCSQTQGDKIRADLVARVRTAKSDTVPFVKGVAGIYAAQNSGSATVEGVSAEPAEVPRAAEELKLVSQYRAFEPEELDAVLFRGRESVHEYCLLPISNDKSGLPSYYDKSKII